jgi:carbonic anhydrase
MNRLAGLAAVAACLVPFTTLAPAQADAHVSAHDTAGAHASADQIWRDLAAGNKRFVDGRIHSQNYIVQRKQLAKSQHPRTAVLSCSDSRVPPEILFDQGLGDLFVVRTAGNSADAIGVGSLEYAVEHLGTTVIVVLGHQSCGAVAAACSGEKAPSANLEAVVSPVAPSCAVAKEQKKGGDVIDFAVHDHVHRVAQDLLAKSAILKHAFDEGHLTIIEAYYSLDQGTVTRLR